MVEDLFWVQWTLVTSLCFVLLLPMWNYVGPFAFIIYWLLLGFSQALVLRQKSRHLFSLWFLVTVLIGIALLGLLWLLFQVFTLILFFIFKAGFSENTSGVPDIAITFIFSCLSLLAPIGGILISWVQGRVLQIKATVIVWWISASAVSWMLGSSLLVYLSFLLKDQYFSPGVLLTDADFSRIISLASVGAVGGAIRGGILTWLLFQSRN